MLLSHLMEQRQSTEKRIEHKASRPDMQTASLFIILAMLTGLFVLGLKLALLTPTNPIVNSQTVESAGK